MIIHNLVVSTAFWAVYFFMNGLNVEPGYITTLFYFLPDLTVFDYLRSDF